MKAIYESGPVMARGRRRVNITGQQQIPRKFYSIILSISGSMFHIRYKNQDDFPIMMQ
jgi:hypothetical protein